MRPTVRLDPTSYPVSVPGPWYRKLFGGDTRNETKWTLTFLTLFVIGLFIANAVQRPQTTTTKAGMNKATISIYPVKAFMPPQYTYQVWVTADSKVQNASFVISFDPSVVALTQNATLGTNPTYTATASKYTDANKSGKLTITLVPVAINNPVLTEGTYHVATLTMKPSAKAKGKSTTIMPSPLTVITSMSSQQFTITQTGADITVK